MKKEYFKECLEGLGIHADEICISDYSDEKLYTEDDIYKLLERIRDHIKELREGE